MKYLSIPFWLFRFCVAACIMTGTFSVTDSVSDIFTEKLLRMGAQQQSEHSPLVLWGNTAGGRPDVVICRTPAAGSLIIRSIAAAYVYKTGFKMLPNQDLAAFYPRVTMLYSIKNDSEFQRLVYGDMGSKKANVVRLMWVRNPFDRMISGFCVVNARQCSTYSTRNFNLYLAANLPYLLQGYNKGKCDQKTQLMSLDRRKQHWSPGQHCRCGLPSGVKWKLYDLYKNPVEKILPPYLGFPETFVVPSNSSQVKNKTMKHYHHARKHPSLSTENQEKIVNATKREKDALASLFLQ